MNTNQKTFQNTSSFREHFLKNSFERTLFKLCQCAFLEHFGRTHHLEYFFRTVPKEYMSEIFCKKKTLIKTLLSDTSTRILSSEHFNQNTSIRTLPSEHFNQNTSIRTLPLEHFNQNTSIRTLPSEHFNQNTSI